MARARISFIILAQVLCAVLTVSYAHADSYARIVRLSDINGDVQIDRNIGQGFEKAVPNLPITQGVRLTTGSGGRAEVEFENGTALRLTANTSVEFSQLLLRTNGDRVNGLRVNQGTVYFHYKHKGDSQFLVSFANRNFDLKRDANLRLHLDRDQAEVAVMKGDVVIGGLAESAKVKKNQTVTLDLSGNDTYEVAKGIREFPTDDWDAERTQYLDQYASNQRFGHSPYAYGFSDLYRYGQFTNAAGYGLVWVPSGMGSGWDPYQDGYWSYYPGAGYVFISGSPWGWTPYRYGSWSYIPAVGGWAWVPGNWNRWNTGVTVVTQPPSWHHPTPPPNGSGGTVVVGQGFRPSRNPNIQPEQGFHPGTSGNVNIDNRPGRGHRTFTPPPSTGAASTNPSAAPQVNQTPPASATQSRPSRQSPPPAATGGARPSTPAPQPHVDRPPSPRMERMERPSRSEAAPAPRSSGASAPAPRATPPAKPN